MRWICLISFCWVGLGQDLEPIDEVNVYVVKEGDTLESITEANLGKSWLWRDNWKLNPQVKDPDKLKIGQLLKIITKRTWPEPTASIALVRRKVEHQKQPNPWEQAQVGETLREKDGLQTYEKSYSQLVFDDGTTLEIDQNSLIFLALFQRNLIGVPREKIEIVDGQADLKALALKERPEIEIVVGQIKNRPAPDENGGLANRTRASENGQAEIMVFSGASEVESAGSVVTVPKGMGTTVKPNQAPDPPSKLLPAVIPIFPNSGASLAYSNPSLSWEQVPEAKTYNLEIFSDHQATQRVHLEKGLLGLTTSFTFEAKGTYFWRVVAVNNAGLDGYVAEVTSLEILSDQPDFEAPFVVAKRLGIGREQDGVWWMDPSSGRVLLEAVDDGSGVDFIEFAWEGEAWTVYEQPIAPQNQPQTLQFRATDKAGRLSKVYTLEISPLGRGPEAPQLKD